MGWGIPEEMVLGRLEEIRRQLAERAKARKVLETLLTGPSRFTPGDRPEGERYYIEGNGPLAQHI